MSRELIGGLPGQADINNQFVLQNLGTTLTDLKKLLKDGAGNYQFGALTAAYYGYVPGTPDYINWMEEAGTYDKKARDKIKKAIIKAVKDESAPVPIKFEWDENGSPQDVIVTLNSSPRSYTIKIVGYPAPAASALAGRKKKKK
jgi:hypothetical protein